MRYAVLLLAAATLCISVHTGLPVAQTVDDQFLAPLEPQVTPQFRGRVDVSPVPRTRVVRPDEPVSEEPQSQLPTNDSAATAVNQVGQGGGTTASGTGLENSQPASPGDTAALADDEGGQGSLPTVRRGGDQIARATQTFRTARAGEATGEDSERGARFLRAPERQSIFDPDAPSPIAPIRTPNTALQDAARLRQLDKMTGTTITFDIAVGEVRRVERLKIELDACRAPNDNDTHGTIAFLKVWDTKREDTEPTFTGWMFAESPALSAMDHPRYDLWVISCTTVDGVESAGSE
ncbi:MAG: DUF2155 domain-containing protein [Pseudomonadota bacterium]